MQDITHVTHVLFDLDGTLIDSAPAILASYQAAFAAAGLSPARPLDTSIIGPPLLETIAGLFPAASAAQHAQLAAGFKHSYDREGYRQTSAYAGIGEMLEALRRAGLTLGIATNKRLHPTELILEHLGWRQHFAAVYALDMISPALPNKAAMLTHMLGKEQIDPASAVYIGDRAEDGQASDANQLAFIAARWGYGSLSATALQAHWQQADTPQALLALLQG